MGIRIRLAETVVGVAGLVGAIAIVVRAGRMASAVRWSVQPFSALLVLGLGLAAMTAGVALQRRA